MRLDRKNKLLLFGFLFALYICYTFAISNTIASYKEYHFKSEMIAENHNAPNLAYQSRQKEKQLDAILSRYKINASESFQSDLLKQLTAYSDSYNLKIIDFKEPHIIAKGDFATTSYIFSLEGSFNGCLALLNKMENNPSLGSIRHLNFAKKRNYKTNVDQLFVEIILQKNKGG